MTARGTTTAGTTAAAAAAVEEEEAEEEEEEEATATAAGTGTAAAGATETALGRVVESGGVDERERGGERGRERERFLCCNGSLFVRTMIYTRGGESGCSLPLSLESGFLFFKRETRR